MKVLLFIDRAKNKLLKTYREKIFYLKTGQRANLIKDVTVINTNLKLGKNVTIYPDVMFYGDGLIEIGDNVNIGNGTVIYSSKAGGVKIGNDVWIAANCTVLKGSVIEDGVIVGAKSLVKGNVLKNSIAVGIPAKHLKYRI